MSLTAAGSLCQREDAQLYFLQRRPAENVKHVVGRGDLYGLFTLCSISCA